MNISKAISHIVKTQSVNANYYKVWLKFDQATYINQLKVLIDEDRMNLVLFNVIDSAIKLSASQSSIKLTYWDELEDGSSKLYVRVRFEKANASIFLENNQSYSSLPENEDLTDKSIEEIRKLLNASYTTLDATKL